MKKAFTYLWETDTGNIFLMGFMFLVFAISLQWSSYKIITHISSKVITEIDFADTLEDISVSHVFKHTASPKLKFLQDQFLFAGQLKDAYKDMTLEYFKNYYSFSVCLTIFSTLLSIALFLVVHAGWTSCSIKLKSFLIFNVIFASFYYFIPKVLNNETNITKNVGQQKTFQGIQLDILSFGRTVDTLNTVKIDSMINSFSHEIKTNYDFAIGIDPSVLGTSSPTDLLNSKLGNEANNDNQNTDTKKRGNRKP